MLKHVCLKLGLLDSVEEKYPVTQRQNVVNPFAVILKKTHFKHSANTSVVKKQAQSQIDNPSARQTNPKKHSSKTCNSTKQGMSQKHRKKSVKENTEIDSQRKPSSESQVNQTIRCKVLMLSV